VWVVIKGLPKPTTFVGKLLYLRMRMGTPYLASMVGPGKTPSKLKILLGGNFE
jgi:hypothetical protein